MAETTETRVPEATASSETQPAQRTKKKPGRGQNVNAGRKKSAAKKGKPVRAPGGPRRPFPAVTIEEAIQIPRVIKEFNGGNPWPPAEVAGALKNISARGDKFWYLSSGARDYGFTVGTRDASQIALDNLGREFVYANSPETEIQALRSAFFRIEVFKTVYEYYQGGVLPDLKYLKNTLESNFQVPPQYHAEFVDIYTRNLSFLEDYAQRLGVGPSPEPRSTTPSPPTSAHSVVVGEPRGKTDRVAFVIMPFVEKTDRYSKGFFEEVLRSLVTPAAVAAGFKVETAKREGSDVIHSTIVNDLLAADLVIADLTEHNPNVLFELGLRMAFEKPTALIRAKGTSAIFDVDNLLRVLDYDFNLWPSTIENDVPRLTSHIQGTWDGRDQAMTYMQILKRR